MRVVAWSAAAACLFTGCGILDPGGMRSELEDARDRWEARHLTSYEIEVRRQCFCGPDALGPAIVRVEAGTVVRRTYASTGEPVAGNLASAFPDVDGLFDVIEDALDRDAHRIEVTYDPSWGVPLSVWIDYAENIADEELGFEVTLPVPLEGRG